MITDLEPDILECEVKWALESITTNKASAGDGIPVELFQILKDDAVKVLHSICQQIWNTQQWPQDWKRSVSIPFAKKRHAKHSSNCHTVAFISYAPLHVRCKPGAGGNRPEGSSKMQDWAQPPAGRWDRGGAAGTVLLVGTRGTEKGSSHQ